MLHAQKCHRLGFVEIQFGTPRKLPKASTLKGRVVVLDIAFAASTGGGFDKVTRKLIDGLGERLVAWVDHHDHERHADYSEDDRFVLATKAQHGACPEMITEALVERVGAVDTIVCHTDFDGLASAAKWLRGGKEAYEGCDDDARAIDTRIGESSASAQLIDRALRARPRDQLLLRTIVQHLSQGLVDDKKAAMIRDAAAELAPIEKETRRASQSYRRYERRDGSGVAFVDISSGYARVDKTELLLLGQKLERVSVVADQNTVTLAAAFDSGENFLQLLGIEGGMPTRVSVNRSRLQDVFDRLQIDFV